MESFTFFVNCIQYFVGTLMSKVLSIFLLCLCFIPSDSFADHDTLIFFDYSKCKRFTTANDPLTDDRNYQNWVKRADDLPADPDGFRWGVYHMGDGNILGVCKRTYGDTATLVCQQSSYNDFPLAGAQFAAVNSKRGLLWFKCIQGCSSVVPKLVYDEGYESTETDPNFVALQKAYKNFYRKCRNGSAREN